MGYPDLRTRPAALGSPPPSTYRRNRLALAAQGRDGLPSPQSRHRTKSQARASSDHVRAPRTFGTCAVDDNSVGEALPWSSLPTTERRGYALNRQEPTATATCGVTRLTGRSRARSEARASRSPSNDAWTRCASAIVTKVCASVSPSSNCATPRPRVAHPSAFAWMIAATSSSNDTLGVYR